MSQAVTARIFAMISVLGLIVAVVATVLGHIGLGPGFNPLALTVSDYALSDRGMAIEVAMIALAAGSLALLLGLAVARAPVRGLPTVLMLVWCAGLLIAAIVPTDPPGVTSMSTAAYVHRYASVTGFVCLPLAGALLAYRFSAVKPWARLASSLRRIVVACAAGIALFWYVAFPGERVLMGLVERGLIAVEIVLLLALSAGLLRVAVSKAHPVARPVPGTRQPIRPRMTHAQARGTAGGYRSHPPNRPRLTHARTHGTAAISRPSSAQARHPHLSPHV